MILSDATPRFDLGGGLVLCWETITPERANQLLAANTKNRPPKKDRIEKYALLMQRGEWRPSVAVILIDVHGVLRNGQHRLMACVKAGVAFRSLVAFGYDDKRHVIR
jgi:hypothetical protein